LPWSSTTIRRFATARQALIGSGIDAVAVTTAEEARGRFAPARSSSQSSATPGQFRATFSRAMSPGQPKLEGPIFRGSWAGPGLRTT
jgi:hypothetical protein